MPELRTGCNQSSPRDTINELPGVLRKAGGISQAITNPPGSDAGSNQKIPGSTEAGGDHRNAEISKNDLNAILAVLFIQMINGKCWHEKAYKNHLKIDSSGIHASVDWSILQCWVKKW